MKSRKPNSEERIAIRAYNLNPDDFYVVQKTCNTMKIVRKGDGRTVTVRI